ncbi:MAG: class I SAM-dependent RNA methyltransferase [Verrucomicrobia bacterium]|nr:class I SAM-dependent RNA methyltransferase [Verrucomicrobiota bacterium]
MKFPPDSLITVALEDVAFGGDGVARHRNQVTFVPFTITSETVEARVVERRRHFQRATLVRVLTPSPHRVEPPCPYFGRCGGCAYQHIDYGHQLEVKRAQVAQTLRRLGHLHDAPVRPVIPSPQPFGYRNRITVHAGDDAIGFFAVRSHRVLDVVRCPLATDAVNEKLAAVRRQGLPPGVHCTLREGPETTFRQVNDGMAPLLLAYLGRHVQGSTLVDAYCGTGFFAHSLASRLHAVMGIEWSRPAIEAARRRAAANETYHLGAVEDLLEGILQTFRPDTLLLDPPADGIAKAATEQILAQPPPRLLYVSCNPATLARDLARLTPAYRLLEVQPFDMFAQTAEIEAAAVLTRDSPPVTIPAAWPAHQPAP